ncbi:M81 family metallopeptidase [Paenibacillus nasutitermitis]|uniref:Microcystinase C n=1 Tax=Paenibacillus nasutitermitis TaxID=1652958 RepID=A0A916YJA6_9BACL|nr:M81 family metallopeptidase [Paenibacillus nasutitermitis]GGD47511.1 microcystinase C [Paenibacillus nasutitermitis]
MRIVVGGILQESNTFSTKPSTIEDFYRYFYLVGNELNKPNLAENEWSGFKKAAEEQGVTLLPTLYTQAVSSGPVRREALDTLKQTLLTMLDQAEDYDGVLFAMHGAWVTEDSESADNEIITAIRNKVGRTIPIVITLDSHANITKAMLDNVDAIVGYQTFPHIDYASTAYRAATLLFDAIQTNKKLHTVLKKAPMIVQAEKHTTYLEPMVSLWDEAKAGEARADSVMTSLFAVQPWLDVKEMGFSVVVVGEDLHKAEAEAQRLIELVWSRRKEFEIDLYSPSQVLAKLAEEQLPGPVVASDSADSPGAGSSGDSNAVLRELLSSGADQNYRCLLSMVDAVSARSAHEAGVGSRLKLRVGHTLSTTTGSPLEIEGDVVYSGNTKFRFGGGMVANLEANMGMCAVIQIGKISLLLMENPTFTGDPAMYRSVGLEPSDADFVLVKSAAQFRAEYEKLTDRIYILDTPGASTANLKSLTFVNIPRPMYPFDETADIVLK